MRFFHVKAILPCSCDSPVLMTFSTVVGLTIEDDDLRWKMAYIQNDGERKADEEPEAEECAMMWKVTPLTPLYAHAILPC